MKIGTFSILVGGRSCNAKCPFCISKMTPPSGVTPASPQVNWRNFNKAALFAKSNNVTTVLLTSKGEPTLWPEDISSYLDELRRYSFPIIELQTNGVRLDGLVEYLRNWYNSGLTTIALSCVSVDVNDNRKIYTDKYPDLAKTVHLLHSLGFSVRLTLMMIKDIVDNPYSLGAVISWCQKEKVEQLTVRSITPTNYSDDTEIYFYTDRNKLSKGQEYELEKWLEDAGTHILTLQHGSKVYDVDGQNVCLSDCLTVHPDGEEEVRQIIFFPDGHLRYDWQREGAIIF